MDLSEQTQLSNLVTDENGGLRCIQVNEGQLASIPAGWEVAENVLYTLNPCDVKTSVPDPVFEQILIDRTVDDILDGEVLTFNLRSVSRLDVSNREIQSLKGIEDMFFLKELRADGNSLTSLDVTKNTELRRVYVSRNQLTSLDVSENLNLEYLYAHNNDLDSIDLPNSGKLERVYIHKNELLDLDVSGNQNLVFLNATSNLLSCINVSEEQLNSIPDKWRKDEEASYSTNCYSVYTLMPDQRFEQALITLELDDVIDGQVLTESISGVKNLEINRKGIHDLTGIEGFSSLEKLEVSENRLTHLDLSGNPQLKEIRANYNSIQELDLHHLEELKFLYVHHNMLESLMVPVTSTIERFYVQSNFLTEIDGSHLSNVTGLDFSDNPTSCVKGLHAAECPAPRMTYVPNDNFEELIIDEGWDNVMNDSVYTNKIKFAQNITIFEYEEIYFGDLIGLQDFGSLKNLRITGAGIDSLDLSGNPNLRSLILKNNNLRTLDLSNQSILESCAVIRNGTEELILPPSELLNRLNLSGNNLTTLDMSMYNHRIDKFDARDNDLTCIQVNQGQLDNTPSTWFINDRFMFYSLDCNSGGDASRASSTHDGLVNVHEKSMSIAPNPNNGVFAVSIENWEGATIEIYSLTGEKLSSSIRVNGYQTRVSANPLAKGLILVKVTLASGEFSTARVLIQ